VAEDKKPDNLSPQQIDGRLLLLEQGVDFALQHAKLWSKYAKDVMMYVEKRAHIEMEYTKNLSKLAMTVRPLINEEVSLKSMKLECQICWPTATVKCFTAYCHMAVFASFFPIILHSSHSNFLVSFQHKVKKYPSCVWK
jgi:hypothetical protein